MFYHVKHDQSMVRRCSTAYPFGVEEHQYNGRGVPTSVNQYYYSLAGKLIGELNGTLMEFLLTDDLGSIRTAITNKAGAAMVKGYLGYGPFGFQQYAVAKTGTTKGYTSQDNDPLMQEALLHLAEAVRRQEDYNRLL